MGAKETELKATIKSLEEEIDTSKTSLEKLFGIILEWLNFIDSEGLPLKATVRLSSNTWWKFALWSLSNLPRRRMTSTKSLSSWQVRQALCPREFRQPCQGCPALAHQTSKSGEKIILKNHVDSFSVLGGLEEASAFHVQSYR